MRGVSLTLFSLLLIAPMAMAEETFDSGSDSPDDYLQPGESFMFTFNEVHEEGHAYHCHPHPWMTGTVTVFAEGELTEMEPGTHTFYVDIVEGETSDDWGYSPAELSIEVGDTVVWNNTGQIAHTVTSESDGHTHDHMDDHMHDDDESTPAPSALLVLAAVGIVAALRRRP